MRNWIATVIALVSMGFALAALSIALVVMLGMHHQHLIIPLGVHVLPGRLH